MEIEKLEKTADIMESIFVVLMKATVVSFTLGGVLYMIFPWCLPIWLVKVVAVVAIVTGILLTTDLIAMSETRDIIARRLHGK